jgi:iron complex transport system ATP-binding protein
VAGWTELASVSPAVELIGVRVEREGRPTVDDVTLAVQRGEVVGLVGANGSGKTTLLRAALGLAALARGEARLEGNLVARLSPARRAALAGYLPQERKIGWSLPAWRIAALGAPNAPPARARAIALAALGKVGMEAHAERGVLAMSGGERARVLLARVLATGAPLLIADEPDSGLDPDAQRLIMELLRGTAEEGRAVLVTLHDLTLAAGCDRLAVLAAGRLVAIGSPSEALSAAVLRSAFGLEGSLFPTPAGPVLAAARVMDGRCGRL